MSSPIVYLMYHDAYRDTGDFSGDIHRAIDEVADLFDEHGIKVTRSGKVFAEKLPDPASKPPERRIYGQMEVKVYAPGVSGKDNPEPISRVMRSVPVKCIPQPVLLPGEEPKSDSAYDRALVRAKLTTINQAAHTPEGSPFSGTLAMVWHTIRAQARKQKLELNEETLVNALRMVQKAMPEAGQQNYNLYQHLMGRLQGDLNEALQCLEKDFTVVATQMYELQSDVNKREVQLEAAAEALGCRPDELVSCDIEGNVIGGCGAWVTNTGRISEDGEDPQDGELWADHKTPRELDDEFGERAKQAYFDEIRSGAGRPDYDLVFDPSRLIQKPMDREFYHEVPTYTLYFWPKDQDPNEDNMIVVDCAGWWGDIKRDIVANYPKELYAMDVERGEKTTVSTFEPVSRRPSWHLGCSDPKCDGIRFAFHAAGAADNDLTELARLTATPDHWMGADEKEMREYKAETEEMLGMPLRDFMQFHADQEHCPTCGENMLFVTPTKTLKIKGDKVIVPEMTICREHGWWSKPVLLEDWDTAVKFYAGDKVKAAERMHTIMTPTGLKYAEQYGETTYTWALDWLQQDEQFEVRKIFRLMKEEDLLDIEKFDEIRKAVGKTFTKKQRRFLMSHLYTIRAQQTWEQVEASPFVEAFRRKLSTVTMSTFHDAYGLCAKVLMESSKLTYAEKSYGWALLNALKAEFTLDAETAVGDDDTFKRWNEGLPLVSFRHWSGVRERANNLQAEPHTVFLIKELVKATYKRLAACARTTSWIEEQENYLYSIEAGDVRPEQARIDDIQAAAQFAKSAAHLADRVKEVLC